MQLTAHNTTNAFIDACNDVYAWGGINDHGKAVIKEMNDLGMVINVPTPPTTPFFSRSPPAATR